MKGLCKLGKVEEAAALLTGDERAIHWRQIGRCRSFFGRTGNQCLNIYCVMVNVYCSTKGSEKAFALLIYLAEKGHLLKKRSCSKWLCSLEHDIEKCIQLVKKVLEPRANYLNIVCSRVINMLLHAGEMGKALKLFKEVKANGINPDVLTFIHNDDASLLQDGSLEGGRQASP
ncbi:unnamed protein product [Linum tenue]|uniref:Pentatricopeptide repeat-containing protein n=1 Tax=Linum tenue TaxID=586396 RepID=A0AAV0GNI2_9ROSI|nr:unnamed protein product [Linum tenue]